MRRPPLVTRRRGLTDEPLWYRDAILYELRVRSFVDGNGDGVGDFQGLRSRLGYLEDLGVTALWLLPFYPSPGRDDGYDIADYTDVHPELGTLEDFAAFLEEAHARGMRVITELVINHTSDQHPWFQRARRAPPGAPERDFYVWSDSPETYAGTRIIFKDFEPSNWSWDPIARAYYWHRFYAHQPDLNFDHPLVHEAVYAALDFWLEMGVDGLRLDAVPYLYEREGTSCENLPETHAFLKRLRAWVDARYPHRMLLAEANQWPEDAAAYFGDGDECHMNFHFPIMPRLFMSIHLEDRFPILDILEQTPPLHETCQWALFLRNHDELTLEMVTEEERDTMWQAYAHESEMRINLGIRRRLAPLVGNDRRKMELMNALLFSMPGTPVLYYGDEIGMGDNVYLGDRNGVRTPMQWSSDRNAGFSRANPQRLVLPVIIDPEYHFQSVNVEAQQNNTNSLLWWMKRLIALRKRFRAFGRGSIRFIQPENPRVLVFLRAYQEELILVVANLSRHVQCVEIDLADVEGMTPIELFGRTRFPRVGALPYLLTLGGYAFYWFALERPDRAGVFQRVGRFVPPVVEVVGPPEAILSDADLLQAVLPRWIGTRPWFDGSIGEETTASVIDLVALPDGARLVITRIAGAGAEPQSWVLALATAAGSPAAEIRARFPHLVVAEVDDQALLFEVGSHPDASGVWVDLMIEGRPARGQVGELAGRRGRGLDPALGALERRPLRGNHLHATLALGERAVLKLYRRLGDGVTPEVEIGRFLDAAIDPADPRRRAPTPALLGSVEYVARRGREPATVASLHTYVAHESNAADQLREELGRFFERMLTRERDPTFLAPDAHLLDLARQPIPREVAHRVDHALDVARLLGRRTAELHSALISDSEPAFRPEAFSALYQRSMYQNLRNLAGTVGRTLQHRVRTLAPPTLGYARALLVARNRLYARFGPLLDRRIRAARTRHHGDLRLEKWLFTGRDYVVVDFAGDPDRPLAERRRKHAALRDLAELLRSFQEVAYGALLDPAVVRDSDRPEAEPWAATWLAWTGAELLRAYLDAAGSAVFVPEDPQDLRILLDVTSLERMLADLNRRLLGDEARLAVPLLGLLRFLG